MPLPKGTRFRVTTTKSGKKVRLAFRNGKVIEAKNIKTGAIHSFSEFKADAKRKKKKKATNKRRKAVARKRKATRKK
jgi:hypothetical protein